MKNLLSQAYNMGVEGFKKNIAAPCLNKEFIALLPYCDFSDTKTSKTRIKLYKQYAKGWNFANLNQKEFYESI